MPRRVRARKPSRPEERFPLDAINRRLLDLLGADARLSITELADRAHLSRATTYARMQRLQAEGVLERFTLTLNSRRLGLLITAVVLVRVRQPSREALSGLLQEMPGVEYCAFISGEHDLIVIARAPDIESLRDQVVWRLEREPAVASTHTVFVLDEIVRRTYVLP